MLALLCAGVLVLPVIASAVALAPVTDHAGFLDTGNLSGSADTKTALRVSPTPLPIKTDARGVGLSKILSPQSTRQGNEVRIFLRLWNSGNATIHDVQVADKNTPGFTIVDGIDQYMFPSVEPNGSRILRYVVTADNTGTYTLSPASVMYADEEENYHLIQSGAPVLTVYPSLAVSDATGPGWNISRLLADIRNFLGARI
jgi:hypothetical protein